METLCPNLTNTFSTKVNITNNYTEPNGNGFAGLCYCSRNCNATHCNLPTNAADLVRLCMLMAASLLHTKTRSTPFTDILMNRTLHDLQFTKEIEENGKLPFLCDGTRRWTSDIVRLTSPNVPLILVGQDKMSDSHLSEKDTNVHLIKPAVHTNTTRSNGYC